MTKPAPLILTLALDERSFTFFDEQRRRYFPPERNFIPAHLTLFHHLPGEYLDSIQPLIEDRCSALSCFPLGVTGLRSLGRGVAYTLQSDELRDLRSGLMQEWAQWLTPQDQQKHQPHVTVQNNVEPHKARALLTELSETFLPFQAHAQGVDLWWYRGGPWEAVKRFSFRGP
ncbi:2'-5' RNA ligase family protein [Microvirga sp. ACRRW]|uniref:2'-5' RNA ligase family protein n=1 Tax=Microvirga sp. ACRRW TaxID=2918205 RepID=UPI001EF46524|nr:2'-5' RNA ligase family protein [Microvirga sp. ACRRW]MCG7393669.1 2'-5' RNA ligase family protein [Microvirga sp. ACRRW]